jgi:hypothetical protein
MDIERVRTEVRKLLERPEGCFNLTFEDLGLATAIRIIAVAPKKESSSARMLTRRFLSRSTCSRRTSSRRERGATSHSVLLNGWRTHVCH